MHKNTIVYFGIIQYEYNNAMCQHAEGIKTLIKASGFQAVTIGVSSSVRRGNIKKIDDTTYVVNDPQGMFERARECVSSRDIMNVLQNIGLKRIKTFIMADFRYFPMKVMANFCKKQGIHFAVDIMDRFVSGNGFFSKIKKLDSELRMKYLYPKVARRIYICRAYNELLGEGEHTSVIPGVTWTNYLPEENSEDIIHLVFLGQPGLRCEKEKIDWVIRAIYEKKLVNKFKIHLAGFDKQVFLDYNPELNSFITDNIIFWGHIHHDACLDLLKSADFSLVIRPDTMLSKYGFSTKIGEAFSCGIPILTTDTSDNSVYVRNGSNGYVCECTYEAVVEMLEIVACLTPFERYAMKKNVYSENPLNYRKYLDAFSKVVIND